MSKRKTDEQIIAEIEALVALKPRVRERNFFGDDNHAAIDAQLAVLRERMDSDEVYDAYGEDGDGEFSQHVLDNALSAFDWMVGALGADEDSPAAGWSEIAT